MKTRTAHKVLVGKSQDKVRRLDCERGLYNIKKVRKYLCEDVNWILLDYK